MDIEVSTPSTVDKPGVKVTIEDTAVGTLAVVNKSGTNTAIEDTVGGTPLGHIELVLSKVITDSLRLSG